MNIVLLTGSNPFINAGIVGYDMYKSIKNDGHSVILLTRDYDPRLENGMFSVYGKLETYILTIIYKVKHKLKVQRKTDPSYCMHSLDEIENYIPTTKILKLIDFKTDLFIYLFPHRFLNAKNLYELNKQTGVPICVIPVDMAQFTGGCHYTNECEGFTQQCGKCPGLYSDEEKDQSFQNFMFKKKYISKTNLYTHSNTWTSTFIKRSAILSGKPSYSCHIPINSETYCPGNKDEAKKFFAIPPQKEIIFFGATSVNEKRKGFSYLLDALNLLYEDLDVNKRDQIGIAIAGNDTPKIINSIPFKTYSLGHLSHDQLPKAYQMADLFVSPSIQDAGPMMVVQSMMCGTPVVAFEMGNAFDYIIDNETGYRVPLYDTHGLMQSMRTILTKTADDKIWMSGRCRDVAVSKSSYKAFVQALTSNFNNFISHVG